MIAAHQRPVLVEDDQPWLEGDGGELGLLGGGGGDGRGGGGADPIAAAGAWD